MCHFSSLNNELLGRKLEAVEPRRQNMHIRPCRDVSGLNKYYFKEQNKICHTFS